MAARFPRIGGHGGEIFVLDRRGIELSPLPSADTGTLWRQACLMSQGLSDDYILRGRQLVPVARRPDGCIDPAQIVERAFQPQALQLGFAFGLCA